MSVNKASTNGFKGVFHESEGLLKNLLDPMR